MYNNAHSVNSTRTVFNHILGTTDIEGGILASHCPMAAMCLNFGSIDSVRRPAKRKRYKYTEVS